MSVSSIVNRVSYSGNGATTAFSFPYYFLTTADLVVISRVTATGVETTKTLTTDYTVTGDGNPAGGTVTMLTAPATGTTLTIYRSPALTQDLNLVENDPMPAEEIEERFDKLTMIAQRLSDRVDRSMRLTDGAASVDLELPAASAGLALGWNDDEDGLINIASPGDLTVTAFGESLLNDTNASEAQTTLGISTFVKTILDDASASAVRTTIGVVEDTVTIENVAGVIGVKNQGLTPAKFAVMDPPVFTSYTTGSGNHNLHYVFYITAGSATTGATYTNNSITYTVYETVASATRVVMSGSGAPTSSGTLTKASGTGDSTLTFSLYRAPLYLNLRMVAGGGGGRTADASTSTGGGGGGGGVEARLSNPSGVYAYAVGAGGASDTSGSNSTFGTCTATGGLSSGGSITQGGGSSGGTVGSGWVGRVRFGQGGGSGINTGLAVAMAGGNGGSSFLGGGAGSSAVNGAAVAATANTGGGGGGAGNTGGAGGAGGSGVIELETHFQ